MPLSIDDDFVKSVLQPVTIVVFLALVSPVALPLIVAWTTHLLEQPEPRWVASLLSTVRDARGLPAESLKVLVAALPALVTAIGFRPTASPQPPASPSPAKRLSLLGRAMFIILMVGLLLSLVELLWLNSDSSRQVSALQGGKEDIVALENAAATVLRLSTTYLALLLGFRIEVK